jgi:hypothetical protein
MEDRGWKMEDGGAATEEEDGEWKTGLNARLRSSVEGRFVLATAKHQSSILHPRSSIFHPPFSLVC